MQQPPEQQPTFRPPNPLLPLPPGHPGKKMMIASVVCGASSLFVEFTFAFLIIDTFRWILMAMPIIGLAASIIGVVMAITSEKQIAMLGFYSHLTTLGLVLSIAGIVFSFICGTGIAFTAYVWHSCAYCMQTCNPPYSCGQTWTPSFW